MSVGSVAGARNPVSAAKVQETNDTASLDRKIEQLKKQIEQIKKNRQLSQEEKDKRIANIENRVTQLEQQKGQESRKTASVETKKRFDIYEVRPQQQSAGAYHIAHDAEGRPIIQADNRLETSEEQPKAQPQNERGKPIIMKTTGNTDQVDREIEQLKQTKSQLEQKIAAANGPRDKETLETQLAQVEAELKRKDNDTYRRQHMEITEQKVVEKVGE